MWPRTLLNRVYWRGHWLWGFRLRFAEPPQNVIPEEDQPEMVERLAKGNFSMRAMYEQFQNLTKMGPMSQARPRPSTRLTHPAHHIAKRALVLLEFYSRRVIKMLIAKCKCSILLVAHLLARSVNQVLAFHMHISATR